MLCSECGSEYHPGFTRCADCDVRLAGGILEKKEPNLTSKALIPVAESPDAALAAVAAAELERNDMSSWVSRDFGPNVTRGSFAVHIAKGDADHAEGLLRDFAAAKKEPLKQDAIPSEPFNASRQNEGESPARGKSVRPPSRFLHNLGAMFMCVAAGLIFQATQIHDKSFAAIAVIAIMSGLIGTFGSFLQFRYKDSVQRHRDWEANQIVANPADHPFSLFLRPFFITNRLQIKNAQYVTAPVMPQSHQPRTIDFEELVQRALGEDVRLIGLGLPGEAIGAGRAKVSEADWRQHVERLIVHAQEIFVIPGERPGVLEELKLIRERGALRKTVFLMPPRPKDSAVADYFRSAWERMIAVVADAELEMPTYRESGMVFTMNDAGKLIASANVSEGGLGRSLQTVRNVLIDSMGPPAPTAPYWTPARLAVGAVIVGFGTLLVWGLFVIASGHSTAPSQAVGLPSVLRPTARLVPDWTAEHAVLAVDGIRIPVPPGFKQDDIMKEQFPGDARPDVVLSDRVLDQTSAEIAIASAGTAADYAGSREYAITAFAGGRLRSNRLTNPLSIATYDFKPEPKFFVDRDTQWSWFMSGFGGTDSKRVPLIHTVSFVVVQNHLFRIEIEETGNGDGSDLKAFTSSLIDQMQIENNGTSEIRGGSGN